MGDSAAIEPAARTPWPATNTADWPDNGRRANNKRLVSEARWQKLTVKKRPQRACAKFLAGKVCGLTCEFVHPENAKEACAESERKRTLNICGYYPQCHKGDDCGFLHRASSAKAGQPEILRLLSRVRGKACELARTRESLEERDCARAECARDAEKTFLARVRQLSEWADRRLEELG